MCIRDSLKAAGSKEDEERLKAISAFFSQWVPLEALLNRTTKRSSRSLSVFNINALKRTGLFDKDSLNQIAFLRKMRNTPIHDIEVPASSRMQEISGTSISWIRVLRIFLRNAI